MALTSHKHNLFLNVCHYLPTSISRRKNTGSYLSSKKCLVSRRLCCLTCVFLTWVWTIYFQIIIIHAFINVKNFRLKICRIYIFFFMMIRQFHSVETWRYTASTHPCGLQNHTRAVTSQLFSCSWSHFCFLKNFETTFNLLVTQIRVLTQIMKHTDVAD